MKSRPQRPLDAVIITLPLEALQGDKAARTSLLNNCQQIQQVCGLSLPIYLLISGLESLEGVTVIGDTGRWRWQGAWSLLKMVGQQRVGGALAQPLPLRFALPVSDGQKQLQATVFLQVALLGSDGKTMLPWVPLTEQGLSGGK